MKALIKGVKIIDESNCDVIYEIYNDKDEMIISDTVNIRSYEKDTQTLEEHVKNVLIDIRDKYVASKESKLSDQMATMLHEEIDLD